MQDHPINTNTINHMTATTTTTTTTLLSLFNVTCTSHLDVWGSIFDGCGDRYEGSHLGYTYQSNWKGVSDRYSCIKSPCGEIVASCDTVRRDGGLWATHQNCPEWLLPLGDDYRRYEAEEAAYAAQKAEEEDAIRRAKGRGGSDHTP